MYFQKFFLAFLLLSLPWALFARMVFSSLFPYTVDDTNLEYIEIRNTGCDTVSLSWYILEDASGKKYIFPAGTNVESHKTKHIARPTSKIILNNVDEKVYIKDPAWVILDHFSYLKSDIWVVISIQTVDENCTTLSTGSIDTNTGTQNIPIETGSTFPSTQTGWVVSGEVAPIENGTWENVSTVATWSVSWEASFSGMFDTSGSGSIISDSWETLPFTWSIISSGALDIPIFTGSGTTNSGVNISQDISGSSYQNPTNTGIILWDFWTSTNNTEIPFPEIFLTLQSPTNAVFGSGFFDCGEQNPCRINTNFDPIFTWSFLEKNYSCQIITATWILSTCNPSILYFSTGSSFSLKLSAKSDTTQSRIVSWEVRFSQKNIDLVSAPIIHSWSFNSISSGLINPLLTESWSDISILFPDIFPTFQAYTNTTFSWDTFTCNTSPCRLNMTFDPIFTGSFLEKNYLCHIQYWADIYETCNPSQIYLTWTGDIEITLIEKYSWEKKIKIFHIIQNIYPEKLSPEIRKNEKWVEIPDIEAPIPILELDGKWKDYFYRISDTEMNCYSNTCSLNFTADRSYDPWGGKIQFLWIFDFNIISRSRDPGAHSYGLWDHIITLRVIDEAGNMSEILYRLHVLGKPTKEVKKKVKDEKNLSNKEEKAFLKILSSLNTKLDKLENNIDTKIIKERKKKQKKLKFTFFVPPEFILQWKTGIKISENEYHCISTKKTCKLNFTLTGTMSSYRYEWIFPNHSKFIWKNPKTIPFSLGKNMIHVFAYQKNGTIPLWEKDITIKVTQKTKKKKVKKPKKITQKKNKKLKEPWEITPISFQKENAGMMGILLFLGWGGSMYAIRQRKKKKNDL